jgi:predicted RNA-binding Zn ribbon-like protein
MYRVFTAVIERWKPDATDLAVLNRELGRARAHERLTSGMRGIAWTWNAGGRDLDRILWPTVRSAADLLTSDELKRLRQCDGEDCRWLFLDTSKNRSRRWCEMADCGNRAKVRRFRRRH